LNLGVPTFRYVVCDVFTEVALAGNQLAVFTDAREIPEEQLQSLAREMNYSETVFVYPPEGEGHVRLRIFTPAAELPLAGHPVLGSAFVLGGPLQLGVINIEVEAGLIPVELRREGPRIVFGWMRLPVPEVSAFEDEAELLEVLGVERAELPIELYDLGIRHVMVALWSREAVLAVEPELQRLARLQGVVGTSCFAGEGRNWKTRMFAPADGVPEDPATGSAAGPLACHLARHGRIAWGDEIEISQGTEVGRPSTLYARVFGADGEIERMEVGGSAVVVARGEFRL
jgi:trans-2,3-dihydro-3-hydroxyanthranilate isomerase